MRNPFIQIAALATFLLAGCATPTNPGDPTGELLLPERVQSLSKWAAYTGGRVVLKLKPDARPTLEEVVRGLKVLIDSERWDAAVLAAVLQNLPIDGFESEWADIGFSSAFVLVDALGYGRWDASNQEHVKAATTGTYEGLDLALRVMAGKLDAATVEEEMTASELQTRSDSIRRIKRLRR